MEQLKSNMQSKYQYIGFLPKSVRIKENGFWGINDFEGNEILPSNYIEVFTLSSGIGLIAARESRYWNIYDFYGNKINSERYDYIYPYYGMFGMSKVKIGNKWGLINKYGHKIIPLNYMKIEKFGKGILLYNFDSTLEFIERKELINMPEIHPILGIKPTKQSAKKYVQSQPNKKTRTL